MNMLEISSGFHPWICVFKLQIKQFCSRLKSILANKRINKENFVKKSPETSYTNDKNKTLKNVSPVWQQGNSDMSIISLVGKNW